MITIPIGCIVGGLVMNMTPYKMDIGRILINLVPVIVIAALIVIGLCYAVSLLGLSTIISKIYGYDGYYALIVVVLPAFIWGIPKIKKLSADKKAELSE